MNQATITFSAAPDGNLTMLTHYDGGFDPGNMLHMAAMMLSEKMSELADAQGAPQHLTTEQASELRAVSGGVKTELPEMVVG